MELLGVKVEKGLIRSYCGTLHIASGSIEQSVDAPVPLQYFVAVLFHKSSIHHIGLHEFYAALRFLSHDFLHYCTAHIFLSAEYYHFSAFVRQIFGYGTPEHTGAAGYHSDVALYVK